MTGLLLAAALGVIAGGSLAVGATGVTGALAGLLGLLILAPLVADPAPSLLAIAVRTVGALLAVELYWIALNRADALRSRSPLGLRAVTLAAAAAAVCALGLRTAADGTGLQPVALGDLLVGLGPVTVVLAAAAALTVAGLPALLGRGPVGSVAIGAAVLITAVELLSVALLGPRMPLEHLLIALTQVALAATTSVLAGSAAAGPPRAGRADDRDGEAPLTGRRRVPLWPGLGARAVRGLGGVAGWRRREPRPR